MALGAKLQNTIDSHFSNVPVQKYGGASVAVIRGSCRWVGVVGEAHPGVPMTPAHMFRVASVTKTFVAATLLSLVDEGLLTLDATVDKYVPSLPGGNKITVRMVLNHTNGLYDYTTDNTFWQQALAQPNTPVAPQTLVDVATSHPPTFQPGKGWGYTSTGFIVAGMVIEAVTKMPASVVVRQRAITPAGLNATFFDGAEQLPAPVVTASDAQGNDLANALHPSVNWTAGAIVATAGDLADWASKLYGGQVLSAPMLNEMKTPVDTGSPGLKSGLGVFLYDASKFGNLTAGVGHTGHLPGYFTDMYYMLKDDTVVVQMSNSDEGKNFTGVLLVALYQLPDLRAAPAPPTTPSRAIPARTQDHRPPRSRAHPRDRPSEATVKPSPSGRRS